MMIARFHRRLSMFTYNTTYVYDLWPLFYTEAKKSVCIYVNFVTKIYCMYYAYNVRLNGIKSFFMLGCLHVCIIRRTKGNSIKTLQFGVYNNWRLRNNVKH